MQIHREGFHTITWLFILAGLLTTLIWQFIDNNLLSISLIVLIWIGWLFIVRFFRSPKRVITDRPNAIISPADGLVVSVEKQYEPEFFQNHLTKISIFMSGNDIHINWVPYSGRITYFKYHPGKNLFARRPKSSDMNERTSIVIEQSPGHTILVKQIAGFMARRVVSYVTPGHEVTQGHELGFIKFGSRVEIFLPEEFKVTVKPGQKVVGTQTQLAILP